MEVAPGEDALFTGDVATDGSKVGNWPGLCCTGVAAVQLKEDSHEEQVVCWGPLPTELPVQRTIARAELWAALLVLENLPAAGEGPRGLPAYLDGHTAWEEVVHTLDQAARRRVARHLEVLGGGRIGTGRS